MLFVYWYVSFLAAPPLDFGVFYYLSRICIIHWRTCWGKFLNKPIPDEPFPNVNDKEGCAKPCNAVLQLKLWISPRCRNKSKRKWTRFWCCLSSTCQSTVQGRSKLHQTSSLHFISSGFAFDSATAQLSAAGHSQDVLHCAFPSCIGCSGRTWAGCCL